MLKTDFNKFALSKGIGSHLLNEYDKYNNRMAYVDPYVIEERAMNITTLSVFSRLMLDRIIFIGIQITIDTNNSCICRHIHSFYSARIS